MVSATETLIEAVAKEVAGRLRGGLKHDAPGSPTNIGYIHGPGGILAFPGIDQEVFHTIMGPHSLLGQLPTRPSLYTNPTYATLTGVTDETGTEPSAICDPGPTAGALKSCIVTAPFGRYKRQTAELELDRLGQQIDRADPMDLTLVGSPIGDAGIFGGPSGEAPPVDLLRNEMSKRLWERNVAFFRLLARQLWQGTPANNVGDAYREFAGLESLITTGYLDAETGVVCPAMDSIIRNANYAQVITDADALIAAITDIWFHLNDRAESMGFLPVRWVIAMRRQLFYELTNVWPCSYLTYRCQVQGQERVVVDANEQVKLRDAMRQGRYLLIDGVQVPVIADDGIGEDTNTNNANVPSGCFGTDIFFIPMSVVGGRAVTFIEYFQYQNPAVQDAFNRMVLGAVEGAFITWPVQTRSCFQLESKIEPRIVMRTPWLAGRLQNVVYCPTQHVRDPFPDDPYFQDGGRTSRAGPSLFTPWQN